MQILSLSSYPNEIKVPIGENRSLEVLFPFSLAGLKDENIIIQSIEKDNINNKFRKTYKIDGLDEGGAEYQLKLLGLIPVKKLDINVVNRKYLVPGGNAIGVRLNTKGVLVVAVTDVIGTDGKRYNPARDAGIKKMEIVFWKSTTLG